MLFDRPGEAARTIAAGANALQEVTTSPCGNCVFARHAREGELSEPTRPANGDGVVLSFVDRKPLTPRENDVLSQIMTGASNKEAALKLGISYRTVEVHRSRIMEKLGAKNLVELVRIAISESQMLGSCA